MKKIQPTIVIGLGGTGVNTITYLKKIIKEQAPRSMDTTRFIAIDIDDLSPDSSVMPSGLFKKEISLDRLNNEFYQIVSGEKEAGLRGTPEIQNWFPEEAYNLLPLTEGARQVKSIGRLGFFLDHNNIHQRLTLKSDELVTPDILDEFPNLQGDGYNVYVISSICGGTGAGLFYDIAYNLRFLQAEGIIPPNARIKGLFALGDVYEGITDRVHANTYASLRELNWGQRANASYRPVYPGTIRGTIQDQAFDTIYLIGKRNESNIQFNEPDDFSVLCAEFIFLDSGADREIGVNINGEMEMREPLATVIQSTRNNPEPYASIIDADGTPRCYSALGLCKIRFPAQQVAELCSARMSMSIICHHILGDLNPDSILKKIEKYVKQQIQQTDILDNLSAQLIIESEKKAVKYFENKELRCDEINTDLPDRLIELKDNDNYIPLDQWAEASLKKAHAFDSKNLKKLEAGRFNTIIKAIDHKIRDLQNEMSSILINELQTFQNNIEREINDIFRLEEIDDLFELTHRTRYIAIFLKKLIELSKESTRFAEDKISELKKREKPFQNERQKQIRKMRTCLKRN